MDKVVPFESLNPVQREIVATINEAKREALNEGATAVVVVLLRKEGDVYASKSVASDNLQQSEVVSLLEIAKSDVIEHMRGR